MAALKFLQPAPLCFALGDRINTRAFLPGIGPFFARERGGSLKRLHRPSRLRVWLPEFEGGGVGIHVMTDLDPGYLNPGLMKPRRGSTPIPGKEKLGVGKGSEEAKGRKGSEGLTFFPSTVIFAFNDDILERRKMAERDPIELIKGQLNRADEMAGLHADHENFKHWHSETKTILAKVFSPKSIHYQSFLALRFREMSVHAFASTEIEKINAGRYKKDLENTRNILQSAIKELTLDRTLFKKIQTTPETVEVSLEGEYFISSGIQEADLTQAVKSAFEGSGLTLTSSGEASLNAESLRQRIDEIKRTKFGIYDLTTAEKTPVLLELGAALGIGKEAIIIHKKGFSFPEWMSQLNGIEYENVADLTDKLRRKVHP